MAGSARVYSIQDLAELRAFLITLADKLRTGLQTANSEVQSTAQWLNHTQPAKWKAETEKSARLVQDATEALRRKRMSPTSDGRPPNTMVEQKMLHQAKQRLEHAQAKSAATRQWQKRFEKEMFEYRRLSMSAQNIVDVLIPKAVAYLDQLMDHLEKYVLVAFNSDPGAPAATADDPASLALPMPDDLDTAADPVDEQQEAGAADEQPSDAATRKAQP